MDGCNGSSAICFDRVLHFHGLKHSDLLTGLDSISYIDLYSNDDSRKR